MTGNLKMTMMDLPVFEESALEAYQRQQSSTNRTVDASAPNKEVVLLDASFHPPFGAVGVQP